MTSITIPNNVTSIGGGAFSGCDSLESITIPFVGATKDGTENTRFGYIFGDNYHVPSSLKTVVITGGTSIGSEAFSGCSGLTRITIGNSVTSIGEEAFRGCGGLMRVTIGNGVTSIGDYAFDSCSSLTSITIPDGVTSIGEWAFRGCSGLTSITIPDSVTSIGCEAFSGCSSLTSITIPNSLTSIGNYAFYGCKNLSSITIPFVGATKNGSSNTHLGYIFGASSYSDNSRYVPSSLKTVVITGGTSIGKEAFSGCSGLTSITIPNSVTSIGDSAFYDCSGLMSITIPNSVMSIGYATFWNCSGLTSITIGNSVTSIDSLAFYDCSGLTSINFKGTKAQWNKIEKGTDWNQSTGFYTIYCTDGTISK